MNYMKKFSSLIFGLFYAIMPELSMADAMERILSNGESIDIISAKQDSKKITCGKAGFFTSEDVAGTATSKGVLIGEQDMPASFSFSKPSSSLAGAIENYSVSCHRLAQ